MTLIKQLIAICILFLPSFVNGQQNHVINGDFETITSCPTNIAQISLCYGWRMYTNGSSDYYNACHTGANAGVPANIAGFQHAASGNAYCGMIVHSGTAVPSAYVEYAVGSMHPLIPGLAYEVSLSVNRSNYFRLGSDNLGIYFYDSGATATISGSTAVLSVTPQVYFSNYGVIADTVNWLRLSAVFVADSAYDNLVIGPYKNAQNSYNFDTLSGTSLTVNTAYYYIDSVVVKMHDSLNVLLHDSLLCAGDTVDINFLSSVRKNSSNVFKIQLSDAIGSFSSPVDIGSIVYDTSGSINCVIPPNTPTGTGYKIRIIASSFSDTAYGFATYKIGNGVAKPTASNNGPVCSNTMLQLAAYSNTQNVQYKWSGPASYTSGIQNPTIANPLPAQSGSYIVTATLYGCEASDTTTAVVQSGFGPTGVLATANGPVCADDTVWVTGASSGTSDTYSWVGPNGFVSSSKDFMLTGTVATQSGDYILTASNGVCVGKDTITVIIKPRPANFNVMYNTPLCTGNTINLTTSTTSTGVTFLWTGPNSFSSTNATPGISGASSVHNGNYYVTATLNGCSLSDTVVVTVKPRPVVPTMNNNGPLCAGETIMLAAASATAGATYSWTGPNSYTSALQNPTIGNSTTSMSGTYTATATLDGCSSSATTSLTVKPMPTTVVASSNTPVCAGSNLLVSIGTSTTGSTYSWTGPNSFSSSNLSNTITAATTAATGWYVAKVALNGCSFKDSVYATVNPTPATPTISFNSPLCVGETLNLNGGSVTGGTYSWTGPNSFSSTQNNPARSNMQWADTGLYKTTVTVNGCTSAEAQARVTMNPVPFVTILSTPMDTICNGEAVNFLAIASNHGGTPLYQWYINGGLASTGATFNTTGLNNQDVVRCDMTEYTKCSAPYKDESNDITITVMSWLAPSVSITANPTTPLKPDEFITFTAKPVDGGAIPKFQWKRNGQNIVGATGAIWSANTLNDNDDICVELTSTYRCPQPLTANSNCIKVRVLTGVDDINVNNKWTVHPNPNNGRFTITATDIYSGEARLEVVNTLGQIVYIDIAKTQQGNITKEIDLQNVAKGIYLLRIYAGDEINIMKLMVE